MYFNMYFNLESWNPDAEYAIFDDFDDWSKWFSYKQWLGAQKEFTVTDKYRKKMNISWGKPTILLSNEIPLFKDQNWIDKNCITFVVKNKLF